MEKTLNWKTEELSQKLGWLRKKVYWRQPIALLAACAVMILVVGVINYAFLVEEKQSIAFVESRLPTEAELQVVRLENILKNMTTQISELKEGHRQQKARITKLEAEHKQYQAKISELQVQVEQLKREDSELESDIKHVNITLAMKDQQDANKITDTITTLGKKLVTTVKKLQASKADQSDLVDLKNTVADLRQTMARESELDSLSGRVTSHITSSQNEHNQLRSRISDNDRDIQSLKNRIGTVESDIKNLQGCTKWFCWWHKNK